MLGPFCSINSPNPADHQFVGETLKLHLGEICDLGKDIEDCPPKDPLININ